MNPFNKRKPKAIRLAEEIFAMWPEEEWERLNFPNDPNDVGVKGWILSCAPGSKCVYSIRKSKRIALEELEICKELNPITARLRIVDLFFKILWKCALNYRTPASFFWW